MFGANVFLLIFSVIELLMLHVFYMRDKVKWEGMWVIFIEVVAYAANLVSPDGAWVTVHLEDGSYIEWLRYCGWILTCPVLLMTLVSMTTEEGTRAPTVRLVPLLVANLTMVLMGITSALNAKPVKWYFFAVALSFGGHVFSSAIQCFMALHASSPNNAVKHASLWLAGMFLAGWGCFPVAFITGHSGLGVISRDVQWSLFVIGDLLSKNAWVAIAALRNHLMDLHAEANAATDLENAVAGKSRAQQGGAGESGVSGNADSPRLQRRRASYSNLIINEVNNNGSFRSGRGGGTGSGFSGSFTRTGRGQTRAPHPYQREVVMPLELAESDRAAGVGVGSPQASSKANGSPGDQADLDVLHKVLRKYYSLPPDEREALTPIFAGLLQNEPQTPAGATGAHSHITSTQPLVASPGDEADDSSCEPTQNGELRL